MSTVKKFLVLIALVIAVTAFGIDASHARRIRLSMPAAKAAPVAAAKPAPVAAARNDGGLARPHFFVTPGVAIRPPNGAAAASAPMADTGTPAPIMGTGVPSVDKAEATKRDDPPAKREEPAERPAQRHFVVLTPDPPRPHRELGPSPPPRANVTLCYKTATGQCGSL